MKSVEEPDVSKEEESTIDSIWEEIVRAGGFDKWEKSQVDIYESKK